MAKKAAATARKTPTRSRSRAARPAPVDAEFIDEQTEMPDDPEPEHEPFIGNKIGDVAQGQAVSYHVFSDNMTEAGIFPGIIESIAVNGELMISSAEDQLQKRPATVRAWIHPQIVTGKKAPGAREHGFTDGATAAPTGAAPEENEAARKTAKPAAIGYHGPPHSQATEIIAQAIGRPAAVRMGYATRDGLTLYCFVTNETPQTFADQIAESPSKALFEAKYVKPTAAEVEAAEKTADGRLPLL